MPELCCGAVFARPAFLAARRGGARPQARKKTSTSSFSSFSAFPAGRRALARAEDHSKSLENMMGTCFPVDSHSKSLANMIGTWHPMDSHTNACFCMFLHLFHVDSCFVRRGTTSKPAKRRAAASNQSDSCFVGTVERTRTQQRCAWSAFGARKRTRKLAAKG